MAWKKPTPKKGDDTSFPGLQPAGVKNAATSQYEERQQDEVMALKAIYGDDFSEHKTTHAAWKKSEPAFDIRIKASSDEDIAVTLGVILTATYPKSVPLLSLKEHEHLRESTLFKVQKYVETKPREYAAEETEMIYLLVEGIREILEDAAIAKAKGLELPSLEEERAAHEAMLAKLAQDEKEKEERKKQEETQEEERALGALVQQERDRQRTKAKEVRKKNRSNLSPERSGENSAAVEAMTFDEPCELLDSAGNTVSFKTIAGKFLLYTGPVSRVYIVCPVLPDGQEQCSLAMKQAELRSNSKDAVQTLKQIQSLEADLQTLKKMRRQKAHKNIVEVLGFRIERLSMEKEPAKTTVWTISILTPFADKGSLEDALDVSGRLDIRKVRAWTRDLLEALDYLHSHGILHEAIRPSNVLLMRDRSGDIIPKLADGGYQRQLHDISAKSQATNPMATAKSAYWFPPEIAGVSRPQYTQKTDVWDFGVLFLQMVFGLDVPERYHSPSELIGSMDLSDALNELVSRLFMDNPKKRPRAFDLASSEFLATDAPILEEDMSASGSGTPATPSKPHVSRNRSDSATRGHGSTSRYREDFVEEGRLGKGGFGEVVKARKKLDGRFYAIKKITINQGPQETLTISDILKEVQLLSQLSHPAVVRYYDAWLESAGSGDSSDVEGDTSASEFSKDFSDNEINIEFTRSGNLDYMSSGGHPEILFADDTDDDEEGGTGDDEAEDEEDDEGDEEDTSSDSDNDSNLTATNDANDHVGIPTKQRMRRGSQRGYRSIMYISMEYCEKRSLRDLITKSLSKDTQEVWRLFRQILEGLAHIHSMSIVHRDLKPENIFISAGPDGTNYVKIGDFGLATTGQLAVEKNAQPTLDAMDETRSIGTSVYVAPEVKSGASGTYTTKVDMYSLGIIFFEMCYPPMLGMQRAEVLTKLRENPPVLPSDFKPKEKSQTDIILSLLVHNPKDRPSGADLLKSGKLPVQMESETIRRALAGLSDPSSPYYQKMLSMLFARPVEQAKDLAWDTTASTPGPNELMRQYIAKDTLTSIFRRHGAVEVTRSSLYPRSPLYSQNVVELLDRHGSLLQLPFDLTMGNARALARNPNATVVQKSYSFGNVFRGRAGGGQPSMFREADFDIVTTDALDLALREAEVIKVVDEITAAFPTLHSSQLCFQLGHSDLLRLIFDFCGVEKSARRAVADVLSRLNIHNATWQKLRGELRSPLVGASATSIDELQKFDFRDTPTKAFSKLKTLFEGTDTYQKASSTLAHLREVYDYCKRFGVANKMYICPLNTWNEAFFAGGLMFSCLVDKKVKDVFAAGGRYDGLIKEYRPKFSGGGGGGGGGGGSSSHTEEHHAVGFSLNWERLAQAPPKSGGKAFLKRAAEEETHGIFAVKRCDVLVASFDPAILRSTGLEILQMLWAHDISAELASDARSPEELVSKNRDESHSWILLVKQDLIKVRTMWKKDVPDADIAHSQLLNWLRAEIRERDPRGGAGGKARGAGAAGAGAAAATLEQGGSLSLGNSGPDRDREQEVRVLVAQTKSKKFNRAAVVEQAQASAARLVHSFLGGPVAAIETTDTVVDLIRGTALSDPESWRRAEQAVGSAERNYTRDVQGMLEGWRAAWAAGAGTRHAFVYNFRTGTCIYYDLGA